MYKERNKKERAKYLKFIKNFDINKIYYIDETGIDRASERKQAYSLRGEPAYGEISGKRFKRINIVVAKQGKKVIAPFEYEGKMDSALFEGWFEEIFLKSIPKDSVIILDNASFHRKLVLYDLAEEHNSTLIFLPARSPDLNPAEKIWANLKNFLSDHSRSFKTIQYALMKFFEDW